MCARRNTSSPVLAANSRFLLQEGEAAEEEAAKQADSVRVSTVDNYQGEEADIVLVSLVRSNSEHRIGFLEEPQRVNVLLPRAKLGLILIGNADTLLQGSCSRVSGLLGTWDTALQYIQRMPGLPTRCAGHCSCQTAHKCLLRELTLTWTSPGAQLRLRARCRICHSCMYIEPRCVNLQVSGNTCVTSRFASQV